jgi:hypothetical protein
MVDVALRADLCFGPLESASDRRLGAVQATIDYRCWSIGFEASESTRRVYIGFRSLSSPFSVSEAWYVAQRQRNNVVPMVVLDLHGRNTRYVSRCRHRSSDIPACRIIWCSPAERWLTGTPNNPMPAQVLP